FEKFFPQNDEDLNFYLDFRQKFEPDNDFVLIGIETHKIFDRKFLRKIDTLTTLLQSDSLVKEVRSPTNIYYPVFGPLGLFNVPYVHVNDTDKYFYDSLRVYSIPDLTGSFFAEKGGAVAIVLKTYHNLSKVKSDKVLRHIEKQLKTVGFHDKVHLAGRIPSQFYIIDTMKRELMLFMSISLLVLIVVLYVTYRTFWGVWMPLSVVLFSVIWLIGILVITGTSIKVITTLLPTIVFIVGISDIVHVLNKYIEERKNGIAHFQALITAIKEMGLATFLTSFTTAIGFLMLQTASIEPVREFGRLAALGVILAYILTFLLLPAVLILNPVSSGSLQKSRKFWEIKLHNWFLWILRKKAWIALAFGIVVIASIYGVSLVEQDNYLLEDLKNTDPHKQDFLFFEEKFSGVRPYELAVFTDSSEQVFDYGVMKEFDKVETYLKDSMKIGMIRSPLTVVKMLNQALHGGQYTYYRFPKDSADYQKIQKYLSRFIRHKNVQLFVDTTLHLARISGKMKDIGGKRMTMLNQKFMKDAQHFLRHIVVKPTGTALLFDKNNRYLVQNMLEGLAYAFLIISAIIFFVFKDWKMIITAIIPNIIPLVFIAGFMGFADIDFKASTSIIFSIAFGIAVDDTIHFISKYKLELMKNKSWSYALKRTFISSGKAIVITSLILIFGFLSLWASSFMSTFYLGVLLSLTLFMALLADLFLLPVLMMYFLRKKKR
ncbi:MAG: hypothetical protein D6707_04140, partial [Bacteroidetes bacterium]